MKKLFLLLGALVAFSPLLVMAPANAVQTGTVSFGEFRDEAWGGRQLGNFNDAANATGNWIPADSGNKIVVFDAASGWQDQNLGQIVAVELYVTQYADGSWHLYDWKAKCSNVACANTFYG